MVQGESPSWRQQLLEMREEMIKGDHVTVEDCMQY
jgi:hypothetical protein